MIVFNISFLLFLFILSLLSWPKHASKAFFLEPWLSMEDKEKQTRPKVMLEVERLSVSSLLFSSLRTNLGPLSNTCREHKFKHTLENPIFADPGQRPGHKHTDYLYLV